VRVVAFRHAEIVGKGKEKSRGTVAEIFNFYPSYTRRVRTDNAVIVPSNDGFDYVMR
jgi:hypothetical protein